MFGDSGITYSKGVEDLFSVAFGATRQSKDPTKADVGGFTDDVARAAVKAISGQ